MAKKNATATPPEPAAQASAGPAAEAQTAAAGDALKSTKLVRMQKYDTEGMPQEMFADVHPSEVENYTSADYRVVTKG